ncbi:MAG: diguanylate cyclase [Anaerolineales bacterium]|nr:diguanylate cyclase [Anaerolineales bacterium]MCZ2123509.1 diguanylate cyclase [Anaerolineales bacterium]
MKANSFDQIEQVFTALGKDLSATTDAVDAADIILRAAQVLIGWEAGYLILYDPAQGGRPRALLIIDTLDGEQKPVFDLPPQKPTENMLKAIEQDGFLSLYEERVGLDASQIFGDRTQQSLSQLFVPVKTGRRIIGVLSAQSYQANVYTEKSLETLKALANHCAGALERIWAQEALAQMAERLDALYRAAHKISASFDVEEIYQAIHSAVEKVMSCDDFVIDAYASETNEIVSLYVIEHPRHRVEPTRYYADHGLSGTLVHTGESFLVNSVEEIAQSGIQFELYASGLEHIQSMLAVPMVLHGKIVGIISAQSHQANAYTKDDQYLLALLASHAAIALDNARMVATIQQMADTDPLTGILTRRKFYELAEREFIKARAERTPLSAIVLDIDDFKKVNDRYGHRMGDEILRKITQQLKKNLRGGDVLCRHGGEEFVVILPQTEERIAYAIAERLRAMIAQIDLQDILDLFERDAILPIDAESARVTASIGIAFCADDCKDLDMLIDQADRAMYGVKNSAKNSVKAFSESA